LYKQNWLQFFFVVKAVALKKQQIGLSKFYQHIISKEVSFFIYDRPVTGINVVAGFCADNVGIKL